MHSVCTTYCSVHTSQLYEKHQNCVCNLLSGKQKRSSSWVSSYLQLFLINPLSSDVLHHQIRKWVIMLSLYYFILILSKYTYSYTYNSLHSLYVNEHIILCTHTLAHWTGYIPYKYCNVIWWGWKFYRDVENMKIVFFLLYIFRQENLWIEFSIKCCIWIIFVT